MMLGRLVAYAAFALLLAGCGPETTGITPEPSTSREASEDEPPRFSEWSVPVHLGSVVNSEPADFDPFVSRDGLSLYFAAGNGRGGAGGRDLWVAERTTIDEPWGTPSNLGAVINTGAHEAKPSLSADGHRLYFSSNRSGGHGGFDLYVTRRRDARDNRGWEPPVSLGSGVNSTADEESPTAIFEDETSGEVVMFFASNRPGRGGFDIYRSTMLPDGTFGAVMLVEELSTAFVDRDPSVRRDGREMYLTSTRPGTLGGADIWVATRATSAHPWSTPVHLGERINSPTRPPDVEQSNDGGGSLSFDGTTLYFHSAFRPGNVAFMFDIWVSTRSRLVGPR